VVRKFYILIMVMLVMVWTNNELDYLKKEYPSLRLNIEEISKHLNKSKTAIHKKAIRIGVHRPRKKRDLEKFKILKKKLNDRHYKKHKNDIYKRKKEWIRIKTLELKNMLGGKCSKCGYNKCIQALEFHHMGVDKEGHITKIIKNSSRQKALKEVKKCILVCANCHRELHYLGA